MFVLSPEFAVGECKPADQATSKPLEGVAPRPHFLAFLLRWSLEPLVVFAHLIDLRCASAKVNPGLDLRIWTILGIFSKGAHSFPLPFDIY